MPRSEEPVNPTVDYTVTKSHQDSPEVSHLHDLAKQLLRMEAGEDTTFIFSYTDKIPLTFDAANPPPPLVPNSRETLALDKFYKRRFSWNCTIDAQKDKQGTKGHCSVQKSFREMMIHNRKAHNRKCDYLCLVSHCVFPFDKMSNAKRHQNLHLKNAVEFVLKTEKKACRRQAKNGKLAKKMGKRRTKAQNRGRHLVSAKSKVTPVIRNTPIKTSLSHLSSQLSVSDGQADIMVKAKESGVSDIEEFHLHTMEGGTMKGRVRQTDHLEWVAITALLGMSYSPSKVNFKFNRN